jgi:23S rRNA (uracil1939-C5)-methyltransferase
MPPARHSEPGFVECPHAPACVGCPFYGMRYSEQLERKRRRVVDAFAAHAPSLSVTVEKPVRAVRLFGYRNQVKLVARQARRGLLLGVYKPGTHQVVDVSRCPVHDRLVARALEGVRRAAERENVPAYDERARRGWLRYVAVRSSWLRKTTQVVLVVRDRGWPGEKRFVERLRRTRGIGGVVLNVNDTSGNTIFSDEFVPVTRYDFLVERVGGLRLKFRPGSFVQANLGAARRAYEKVVDLAALSADDVAVDLYCGVGAISLSLGATAKLVFGIEASRAAVVDAVENTRLNGLHNVRFRAGPVAELLPQVAAELGRVDVVTLNPPRKGAGAEVMAAIADASPGRVVYMSCDPESLARDLATLAAAGYRTTAVHPFDFLPQTDHIECVAVAVR